MRRSRINLGGELRGGLKIGLARGDPSGVLGLAQLLRRFGMLGLDSLNRLLRDRGAEFSVMQWRRSGGR